MQNFMVKCKEFEENQFGKVKKKIKSENKARITKI